MKATFKVGKPTRPGKYLVLLQTYEKGLVTTYHLCDVEMHDTCNLYAYMYDVDQRVVVRNLSNLCVEAYLQLDDDAEAFLDVLKLEARVVQRDECSRYRPGVWCQWPSAEPPKFVPLRIEVRSTKGNQVVIRYRTCAMWTGEKFIESYGCYDKEVRLMKHDFVRYRKWSDE